MFGIFTLFPVFLALICFSLALNVSKVKRNSRFQQLNSRFSQIPSVKKDIFQSYSSKNKECYEHEAKQSIQDPKPKKKWNLWNEPSWDDELK